MISHLQVLDELLGEMQINLAIVGSRRIPETYSYSEFERSIDVYLKEKCYILQKIISGGCSGIDEFAEIYAGQRGVEMQIFQADWEKYGRSAGPKRNKLIVENSSHMIAFPSSASRGTWDSIRKAKDRGVPVEISRI